MEIGPGDLADFARGGIAPEDLTALRTADLADRIDAAPLPARVMAALLAHRIEFEIDVCELFDAQLREIAPPLIDARLPRAHATAHIAGSINLPAGEVTEASAAALPRAPFIAVYGSDALRLDAVRTAHALAELGYAVKLVNGGFAAWIAQGFPVAQVESERTIAAL
ncbi:rhodanese-like domain-containing protein [Sphingomonas sp. LB-2]|uniref:rhodanese-like domain-containing protein n=1 Tax=Sphingomonas caeni TaxID=2984949 RepID=UPI00222EA112|nr:rhodanese-like domain-containing protein [Sphingomonas caeni]MCW3846948.1 rhodanese-like domain-containing protein [Sphingomonas caeni]